jgi:hypothetical protein
VRVTFPCAACVDPTVFQPICQSSVGTEPQFGIANLACTRLLFQVVECNLIVVFAPSVGENGVGSWRRAQVFGQGQLRAGADLQETHNEQCISHKER